jgi:ABC-type uncharacterized transport system ATPase subunit
VLQRGRVVNEGPCAQLLADENVTDAYLGHSAKTPRTDRDRTN